MKWYKNIYIIILIGFCIWMLFLDTNSFLIHNEQNKELEKLEDQKEYYQKQIIEDKKDYQKLNSDSGLETFAREKYYMKKANEDIYIIEYEDSLKTNDNE